LGFGFQVTGFGIRLRVLNSGFGVWGLEFGVEVEG